MTDHKLSETADLFAVYLRQLTGLMRIVSHVSHSTIVVEAENLLFSVSPPPRPEGEWLVEISGVPWTDLAYSDSAVGILRHMAKVIFKDRLADAQHCFEFDHNELYNPGNVQRRSA